MLFRSANPAALYIASSNFIAFTPALAKVSFSTLSLTPVSLETRFNICSYTNPDSLNLCTCHEALARSRFFKRRTISNITESVNSVYSVVIGTDNWSNCAAVSIFYYSSSGIKSATLCISACVSLIHFLAVTSSSL